MTTYDARTDTISSLKTGDIINAPYSGRAITINLPIGIYRLEVWGAQGGYRSSSTYGGRGGYAVGTLTLAGTRAVVLRAGGAGSTGGTSGGYNGGGRRGTYDGGGGGSDIRLGSDSLYARVIVAGGGGSDGATSRTGGAGGGTVGGTYSSGFGTNNGPGNTTYSGTGASTTASSQSSTTSGSTTAIYGGFGFGGNGQGPVNSGYGGAGGGGWYGGSGTQPDSSADDDKGGAGGSGYVYTASTASQYPSGCLLTSVDYLADASTTIGTSAFTSPTGSSETGHAGDGYCRITVIKVEVKVKAIWMADGAVVRTDDVSPGGALNPPDVSKAEYTYVWQVDGTTVDIPTYDIQDDTTFTAVYTAITYRVEFWDNGVESHTTAQYGHTIDLPSASHGLGRFIGWWDGSSLYATTYMVTGPKMLLARYDLVGSQVIVDSVAIQPNPVQTASTILISVSASAVETEVPRWDGFDITTGAGLLFSSPYQIQIWDTTEEEDIAVFEGRGIKTTGKVSGPLSAPSYPSPRVGAWSDAISDETGAISWTIAGTGDTDYTSSIVVKTSSRCTIRRASIIYTSSSGATVTRTAMSETDTITLPSATYRSFTITVQEVSEPNSHVRVLNVAPGGV